MKLIRKETGKPVTVYAIGSRVLIFENEEWLWLPLSDFIPEEGCYEKAH